MDIPVLDCMIYYQYILQYADYCWEIIQDFTWQFKYIFNTCLMRFRSLLAVASRH